MISSRTWSILIVMIFTVTAEAWSQSNSFIGPVQEEEILAAFPIYEIYKDRYQPEAPVISQLVQVQDSVKLMVFWGSWCKDSKKQVPRMMKVLEAAGNPFLQIQYVGVDEKKNFPKRFLNKFNIKYIPTIVVLKGDLELGRITEKPRQSVEAELVQILGNKKKSG